MNFIDMFVDMIDRFAKHYKTKVLCVGVNQLTFKFLQSCTDCNISDHQIKYDNQYNKWFESIIIYIDESIENGNFVIVTED